MSDPRPPAVPTPAVGDPTPPPKSGTDSLPAPGAPGVRIPRAFGRYRILDRIGVGGMGAVFRAHDTQLDRVVALKVPFLGGRDPGTEKRFYREARAAAALHHPNICPVFDVGEYRGQPYLTMAYVEGRSLARMVEEGGPLDPTRAARIVRKVALAMQTAHDRGVVHRDLKPANILVQPDGEPVVMDFGLARRGDDQRAEGLTRRGDVVGTLEYMAPEQIEGDNAAVGPSADVYALGVVLFELMTGRRPFVGSTTGLMAAVLFKPPPRPGEMRPGLPPRLEEICLRAMAKKPADRYPTMAAFAAALTDYLTSAKSGRVPAAARPAASAPPTPPPKPVPTPVAPAAGPADPGPEEDPGWEVVEDPPRPAVKARLVRPRRSRKAAAGGSYRPVLFGGVAFAAACLSLILAAVIMRPSGGSNHPAAPPSDPPSAKAPHQARPGGDRSGTAPTPSYR